MTISINDVKNDIEGLEFKIKLSIPRDQPVRVLKEQIAKRFDLKLNEFYLCRQSNDKEIREMSTTLQAAGLTSHAMVKVCLGTPSLEGAYQIKISVVQMTDDCTDQGNQLFTCTELGPMVLNPEETGL